MNKIFTILLIALNTTLFAQEEIAKDVLDKLSATTKAYKNITINFNFILENTSQNIKESQKGILVLKDTGFRLEMDAQTIINDGEIIASGKPMDISQDEKVKQIYLGNQFSF